MRIVRHPRTSRARAPLLTLLVPLAVSCGGGDGGGTTPTTNLAVANADGGGALSAPVGEPLPNPMRVRVTRAGVPEPGVNVTWAVFAGTGAVSPTGSQTNADGIATTTWTLGTIAGQQEVRATVAGASGSPVTFTAIATPGAPAAMARVSGDGQTAPSTFELIQPLRVAVTDQFTNGVPGVSVAWAVTTGVATLPSTSTTTDASGIAQVIPTLGAAGPITLAASVAGLDGSPVSFTATAVAPADYIADVQIRNNAFVPASVAIPAGSRVRWTMTGTSGIAHNVTSVGQPSFPTTGDNLIGDGTTLVFSFATPGTYRYQCTLHSGMNGTIEVR